MQDIREIYLLISPYFSFLLNQNGKKPYHYVLQNSITEASKSKGIFGFIVLDEVAYTSNKEYDLSLKNHALKNFGEDRIRIARLKTLSTQFFYDKTIAQRLVDPEKIKVTARGTYTLRGVMEGIRHLIDAYNIPSKNAFINLQESIDGGRIMVDKKFFQTLPELIDIEKTTAEVGLDYLIEWKSKRIEVLKKLGLSFA
ncbi:MAG: hypothetical protein MRJ65_05145 [Candidatus Brocadiaceae bacterium]|nr:hypothetical protein [Candidatus Brocadiaceae bacterium]